MNIGKLKNLLIQPYSSCATVVLPEGAKKFGIQVAIREALSEMNLVKLEKFRNYDFDFRLGNGNTLLHELVISCLRTPYWKNLEEIIDKMEKILTFLLTHSSLSIVDTNNEGDTPITLLGKRSEYLSSDLLVQRVFKLLVSQKGENKALLKRNCYRLTTKGKSNN